MDVFFQLITIKIHFNQNDFAVLKHTPACYVARILNIHQQVNLNTRTYFQNQVIQYTCIYTIARVEHLKVYLKNGVSHDLQKDT
jgi:hypothetical protein